MTKNQIHSNIGYQIKRIFLSIHQKNRDLYSSLQLYWGDKNSNENKMGPGAPTYIGAIVIFLFVLSLLYYKSSHKYWILPMIVIAVMLSWGYHLPWFSQFFIDYFPMYNKFRAVQWFLIIASFGIIFISFLSLNNFFNNSDIDSKKDKLKKLLYYRRNNFIIYFASIFVS